MKRRFPIVLFPLVLLIISCIFPSLDTEHFAKVEPRLEDLNGKYVPTKETLKDMVNQGRYEVNENRVFIRLLPNGNFEMQNMPDWWLTDFGESQGCLINGQGNWEVVKQHNWWQLRFDFLSESHLCIKKYSSGLTISVPIAGNNKPYSLWFYVGDPDTGHVMIFQKIEGQ
ncbi:MAG TPA: hypothetical protein VK249_20785 [Anaerolineales bacterium]|nr:hypothetical protein [Anaerolineales bacterium]